MGKEFCCWSAESQNEYQIHWPFGTNNPKTLEKIGSINDVGKRWLRRQKRHYSTLPLNYVILSLNFMEFLGRVLCPVKKLKDDVVEINYFIVILITSNNISILAVFLQKALLKGAYYFL
jgi:hypothetical protein